MIPESPEGYTPYKQYSISRGVQFLSMAVLLSIAGIIIVSERIVIFPEGSLELFVGAGISISATLYSHESLHYLACSKLGYEPVYLWPNRVFVPGETLDLRESTIMLLAPQLLSVTYAGLVIIGLSSQLELVVGWGLVMNLGGAAADVSWVVRRITWPSRTKVIVGDDHENYVAFPKDS